MKLTKFQHACFTVEKSGATLVVDPGVFSHDFIIPRHVIGIVITHDHTDHLDTELLQRILVEHPKAIVIGHESITTRFPGSSTLAVSPGEAYAVGSFSLRFFGGTHAPIGEGIPTPSNYGVLIDESLYYPGDSFTIPDDPVIKVQTLALPISAPWLKFEEVQTFLAAIKPKLTFPTHDGILSEDGKRLAETMVGGFAQHEGIMYRRLDNESIELT